MSEWQPIETAPMDGTFVIGRGEFGNVYECAWFQSEYFAKRYGGIAEDYVSGWFRTDENEEECPVHWMPLPAPPVNSEEVA